MDGGSIAVIKVRDVLMVVVPANPTDETITLMQEKILKSMDKFHAKGLILDISTVDTLDSFFARTVVETADMVALMGGRTVIAGMNPSVAITATELGLVFGNTMTVGLKSIING